MFSVPIQSVQLFSVSADGRETMVDYHSVTLTETSLTDRDGAGSPSGRGRGGSGVACVAAVNGSLTPPDVRIMMDDGDVTRMFVATEQSRIIEDPEVRLTFLHFSDVLGGVLGTFVVSFYFTTQ